MEEKKNTTAYEKMWMDIKELEDMVNRIYYIGQFEVAERFEKRVNDLKKRFLSKVYSDKNQIINFDFDDIISEPIALKAEIEEYFAKDGTDIENKMIRERYAKKIDEISQMTEKTSTAESWESLRKIVDDWKKECQDHPRFEVQELEINKNISKAVLSILESQAKNGEKVDLKPVDEVCSRVDLADTIKEKFIQIAKETNDPEKREELLDTAKYLTEKRLSDPKVWEQLVGINSVKVKKEQTTAIKKQKNISKPGSTGLLERFKGKTIYTFGDIDPDTGEWINVEEVRARFPKILSKKQADRLLKIEMNGVSKVRRRDFQKIKDMAFYFADVPRFENLQEIVLGDDVKEIEPDTFRQYESLKNVKIGEGITCLPESCFEQTGLKSVEIPGNVKTIEKNAFNDCKDLREVTVKKGVKRIQENAFNVGFSNRYCCKISLPETIEILNSRFIVFIDGFEYGDLRRFEIEVAEGIKVKFLDYIALFKEGRVDKGKLTSLIEEKKTNGNLSKEQIGTIAKQIEVAREYENSGKIIEEIERTNKENPNLEKMEA